MHFFTKITLSSILALNAFSQNIEESSLFQASAPLATIPVGDYPRSVALNSTRGAVANQNSSNVSVFDPSTFSVLSTFATGGAPNFLILNGTSCVVSTSTSNGTVQGFDINTLPSSGAMTGLGTPTYLSYSGTTGAVSCVGDNTLQFFDITNPSGTFYAAGPFGALSNNAINNSKFAVISYPLVGLAPYQPPGFLSILSTGIDPTFLAMNENTLVVLSGSDNIVNIFNPNAFTQTGTFTLPSGSNPQFCALNGTCLVVSCQGSGELSVIDTSIPQILGTISIGGTVERVALDGEYGAVGNSANNTVTTFNTSSLQVVNTYTTGDLPYRLAVSGTIGVTSNRGSDTLTVFSLTETPGPEPVEYALPGVNFGSAKATVEQLNAMSVNGDWLIATAEFYAELIELAGGPTKPEGGFLE